MSSSDACDAAGDDATPDATRDATDRMDTGGGAGRVLDFDLDLSRLSLSLGSTGSSPFGRFGIFANSAASTLFAMLASSFCPPGASQYFELK